MHSRDAECVCGGMSFFFNDTATTEIYTLSLHDALPICIEGIDDRLDVGLHCLRDRILVDRFRAFGAASGYKEERRRQYPDTLHHCAPSFVLQLSIASSHLPSVPRR